MPKKEITLKCCPLCGSMPTHQVDDMGTGSYQHYYGCFNYIYKCPKCGVIHASADTVYNNSGEDADTRAKEAWNKKCNEWEKTLSWRKAKHKDFARQLPAEPKAKKQKVLILSINGFNSYEISTGSLESHLAEGWRVVNATPVMSNIGQVSATKKIIYVLEKDMD